MSADPDCTDCGGTGFREVSDSRRPGKWVVRCSCSTTTPEERAAARRTAELEKLAADLETTAETGDVYSPGADASAETGEVLDDDCDAVDDDGLRGLAAMARKLPR